MKTYAYCCPFTVPTHYFYQHVHDGDAPVFAFDALPVASWQATSVVDDGRLDVAKAAIRLPAWVQAK